MIWTRKGANNSEPDQNAQTDASRASLKALDALHAPRIVPRETKPEALSGYPSSASSRVKENLYRHLIWQLQLARVWIHPYGHRIVKLRIACWWSTRRCGSNIRLLDGLRLGHHGFRFGAPEDIISQVTAHGGMERQTVQNEPAGQQPEPVGQQPCPRKLIAVPVEWKDAR